MTNDEKQAIYKQYQPLIQNVVKSFHRSKTINYDELLSEANYTFVQCLDKYNGSTAIATFLKTCIRNSLINYCRKIAKSNEWIIHDDMDEYIDKEPEEFFLTLFDENEDETIQVISIVIRQCANDGIPRKYGWLDKQIHKITGMPYKQIWDGFKKAKGILQQYKRVIV